MAPPVIAHHFWEISFYLISSLIFIGGGTAWAVAPRLWPEWTLTQLPFPGPAFAATRALGPGEEARILKANFRWERYEKDVRRRLRDGDAIDRRIALQICRSSITPDEQTRAAIHSIIAWPCSPEEYRVAILALQPPYSQQDALAFLPLLDHADYWMRHHAIDQLACCPYPNAISALLRHALLAKHEHERIRIAVRNLGGLAPRMQRELVYTWWLHPAVQSARPAIAERLRKSLIDSIQRQNRR